MYHYYYCYDLLNIHTIGYFIFTYRYIPIHRDYNNFFLFSPYNIFIQEHHIPRQPESPTKIQAVKAATPARHLHAVHQLPELDPPPRHDDLDVGEQVPEITRGQRGTRHDHDERFAQLTQAREDSGKLTEGWVGHHALTKVVCEEVDVLVDDIEAELGQMLAGRPVAVEGFPKGP